MNKIYAFIAIMICAIPFGSQAQSQRFEGTAVENSKQPSLDKIFTKYSLFRINTEAVAAYTQATASMGSYITLDLLQYASPYREKRFVKTYADLGTTVRSAIGAYVSDVKARKFPQQEHVFQVEQEQQQLYGSGKVNGKETDNYDRLHNDTRA